MKPNLIRYDILFIVGILLCGVVLFPDESPAEVIKAYAVTPYDRCMEAFEGTTNATQCEVLR